MPFPLHRRPTAGCPLCTSCLMSTPRFAPDSHAPQLSSPRRKSPRGNCRRFASTEHCCQLQHAWPRRGVKATRNSIAVDGYVGGSRHAAFLIQAPSAGGVPPLFFAPRSKRPQLRGRPCPSHVVCHIVTLHVLVCVLHTLDATPGSRAARLSS